MLTIDRPAPGPAWVDAPSEESFRASFGPVLPPASYVESALGTTAVYLFAGSDEEAIPVVIIHGIGTPALGMLQLVCELRKLRPTSTIALYDLWGHGLSSTPNAPHTPALFDHQLLALLAHLQWSRVHLVGYSLGASIGASFVASHSRVVRSFFLVAPAGLLRKEDATPGIQKVLSRDPGDKLEEGECRAHITAFLEGEEGLVVPSDWQARVRGGQVVPSAIRQWQLDNHAGHAASVSSIIKDGGPFDKHAAFRKAGRAGIPSMAVLGARDDVCSPDALQNVGFGNCKVIAAATHDLVRANAEEIARILDGFLSTA